MFDEALPSYIGSAFWLCIILLVGFISGAFCQRAKMIVAIKIINWTLAAVILFLFVLPAIYWLWKPQQVSRIPFRDYSIEATIPAALALSSIIDKPIVLEGGTYGGTVRSFDNEDVLHLCPLIPSHELQSNYVLWCYAFKPTDFTWHKSWYAADHLMISGLKTDDSKIYFVLLPKQIVDSTTTITCNPTKG